MNNPSYNINLEKRLVLISNMNSDTAIKICFAQLCSAHILLTSTSKNFLFFSRSMCGSCCGHSSFGCGHNMINHCDLSLYLFIVSYLAFLVFLFWVLDNCTGPDQIKYRYIFTTFYFKFFYHSCSKDETSSFDFPRFIG